MPRPVLAAGLTALAVLLAGVNPQMPAAAGPRSSGEWRVYGSDFAGSRYSPLDQLTRDNFSKLGPAWSWDSIDNATVESKPELQPGPNEATPLMIGGRIYTPTSLNYVVCLDASTGQQVWTFDPGTYGHVHRGVAYWEGRGKEGRKDRRILIATNSFHLYALDAGTGKPIPTFGEDGRVDMLADLRRPSPRELISVTSPPIVCGDVVIVGSAVDDFQDKREMPPGDIRGYDVRTGKLRWTFHTVPQEGEFGADTWEEGAWKYTGNTNVWQPMSYDPELGCLYAAVTTPSDDWYGGHRKGAGLFGECLVCLNARTGKRVWHFQLVHHGLWDYDPPCAPNLLDVTVNGKRVKAVAQVTKQAFCFAFDRVTGKPLWPIEERPAPPTVMPGDRASETQPFPTKPPAFDRQGLTEDDLIDYTPELRKEAIEEAKKWRHGPLYTPPATQPTIEMPGWVGGASWAGAAVDPETGILYVPSVSNPMWLQLEKPESPSATVDFKIGQSGYRVPGPRGLPLVKGPYGRITAIDMNRGENLWMVPSGDGPRNHEALKALHLPPLGVYHRTYVVVTKTLLLATQEGSWFNQEPPTEAPTLRAYDKRTGELIGQVPLPAHATGGPITYLAGGRQFVAVPVGGSGKPARLVALALP